MKRFLLIIFVCLYLSSFAVERKGAVDSLDRFIARAIDERYFPGAQLVVGSSEGVLYSNSYGFMDYSKRESVDSATLYDLASCTKVLATTLATMTLVDEGLLSLSTTIGECEELVDTLAFGSVTVENLLLHDSGFLPGVTVSRPLVKPIGDGVSLFERKRSDDNPYIYDRGFYVARNIEYDSLYVSSYPRFGSMQIADYLYLNKDYLFKLDSMISAAYRPALYGKHQYSDLNFYHLQKIIEKRADMSLDSYVKLIYNKMGLSDIGFRPLDWSTEARIPPTEFDPLFRRDTIRGRVHDELACVQGGVAGNAGLFGTATSVAQICAMFLRGGVDYSGHRIVESETLEDFTSIRHFDSGSVAALGFTKVDNKKLPYTTISYGHTGFTGTYFWIDPERDLYLVFLTNGIYPSRTTRKLDSEYRGKLWELVVASF